MILSIIGILLGIVNLVLLYFLNKKISEFNNKVNQTKNKYLTKQDLEYYQITIENKLNWFTNYKRQIDKKLTSLKEIITYVKNSSK